MSTVLGIIVLIALFVALGAWAARDPFSGRNAHIAPPRPGRERTVRDQPLPVAPLLPFPH